MKKLSMCRICLVEDVRMQLIVDSHLQEIYESLTSMPFETEDNRPLLACYMCCAKLKNCYQLRKQCLRSEELFTQMLNSNMPVPAELGEISPTHRLRVTAVTHLSLGYVDSEVTLETGQSVTYDVQVKVEEVEDFENEPFAKDAVESVEDAQSLFVEDDLLLPVVMEGQSDVPTSAHVSEEYRPTMPTNSEDLTSDNRKGNKKVKPKTKKAKELQNNNKMTVKDKTETNDDLPKSHDKVNLYQKKNDTLTSAVKIVDKGKSAGCEKPHQCHVCEKRFDDKSDLITHALAHAYEPHECNICEKCFGSKWQLNIHVRSHIAKKPHQCNFCGKCFDVKSNLTTHIRSHTGEKPYQCNVCKKCFSVKYSLNKHIRSHTGEKPHQCNVCKKCFSTKGGLQYHIRTHTGEKPHQCNVCMKCFSTKYKLKYHIRTHTGEKLYQCDMCAKCLSEKTSLINHIRSHTGEKPHQCDVCKKCFSTKGGLRYHIRTHTDEKTHQCNVCLKCFCTKYYLKCHIRTHTGEKPYQCDMCTKCFSEKKYLINHIHSHTGEKPYQC